MHGQSHVLQIRLTELFSCLLEYGSVTREELEELKALIAEKEAEGDDG